MKTDKELLILAAKAIGGDYLLHALGHYYLAFPPNWNGISWNPLTDSADALRLAVDLGIGFMPDYEVGEVNTCYMIGRCGYNTNEEFSKGKHAATRRAIVRAAAAIGEDME